MSIPKKATSLANDEVAFYFYFFLVKSLSSSLHTDL